MPCLVELQHAAIVTPRHLPSFCFSSVAGIFTLRPAHVVSQEQCLDFYGSDGSITNGIELQQYECVSDDWQQFALAAGPIRGAFFITDKFGRCMDVPASTTADVIRIPRMYACHNGTSQQFYLDRVAANTFRLRSRSSSKCLDIYQSDPNSGAAVIMWACTETANQRFAPYLV